MGTRCDFYVGKGKDAEWIGSLGFDGYRIDEARESLPSRVDQSDVRACWAIKTASTEQAYRDAVAELLKLNDDATLPAQGWPWPWNDSLTTDYAYAFVDGRCQTFPWGGKYDEAGERLAVAPEWPDMSARKSLALDARSGMIVLKGGG